VIKLDTAAVFLDFDEDNGIGVGHYRTQGMLDVAGDIYQGGNKVIDTDSVKDAILSYTYPVGAVYYSYVNTSPASFLGGTWSTLPADRSPMIIGTTVASAGATAGEATHTTTVAEMPSHAHNVYDPGHSHYSPTGYNFVTRGGSNSIGFATNGSAHEESTTRGAGTGISIYANGGGAAHNNIHPVFGVYGWRRTA